MAELVEQNQTEESAEALYTVVAGEGDGFMLGLAAGDTAGGAWDLGYSAVTEQATVIAYQLIATGSLDEEALASALLELDGHETEERVLRCVSPEFRAWLDRAASGRATPGPEPSIDMVSRTPALGVAFRRDPERLVQEAIRLGTLFHSDAPSVAAGVVAAAAVAASCFAQSGLDLIAGVAEAVEAADSYLASDLDNVDGVVGLSDRVSALMPHMGVVRGSEALSLVGGDATDPLHLVFAGLLLAAPVAPRHHVAIEQAAHVGGSRLAALVGAVVGARVGIRAWPWAFANDTWFAEIGRRLVRGPSEVRDLPIPYAVEQHIMSGGRPGFH